MTRKRFHYDVEELRDDLSSNGVSVREPDADYVKEFYDRVGEQFPVVWESKSRAEPIINSDDLPESVSEVDVEKTLSEMKADGIL